MFSSPPSQYDVSFSLFRFPTTIQPLFWLIAALLAGLYLREIDNMPIWIVKMLLGMVAIMISILVHELGHALVFRYVFRTPCAIVLHGMGGLAIPLHHFHRSYGFRGMLAHCFLSFAGPLAGFILGFLIIVLLLIGQVGVHIVLVNTFPFLFVFVPMKNVELIPELFLFFLNFMIWISIVWGIFNLLPIYPMDGGNIFREIFSFFSPRQGVRFSLVTSMTIAIVLAAWALHAQMFFVTILFVYFAYQNYQEMSFRSFRR